MADTSTSSTELNRVKYSGLDFDTLEDDLLARIQVKFASSFNDFAVSSLGIMLLDLVAFGLDTLSFYLDRRASDLYLSTARTRRSVARLTRQLGYKMRPAVASSVDLSVALTQTYAIAVPIPKGFQFVGPNGLLFEAAQAVSFAPGAGPANPQVVPCYEGVTYSDTFTSDGTSNQVFELRRVLPGKYVVSGSVRVLVNGSEWAENEFLSFDPTNQFEVGYNDDPPTLRFGDGVAGNIPPTSSTIVLTYVVSSGKAGLVSRNTIQAVQSPLVVSLQTIALTVNNPEGSIGGDDPEDLQHAKTFAPRVFKSRLVAVTREDYEALAGSYADPLYGRVAVAQAISSRSAATDLELVTLVGTISAAISAISPSVSPLLTDILARVTGINADRAVLTTTLASVAAATTAADQAMTDTQSSARTTKNKAIEISSSVTGLQAALTSGAAAIAAVTTAGTDQLTTATKSLLTNYFTAAAARATDVGTAAAVITSTADVEIAQVGTAKDQLAAVGLTVGTGLLGTATTKVLSIGTYGTSINTDVAQIQAIVVTPSESLISVVEDTLGEIEVHVDKILAADCQANVVSVPILARDAGGFYAAPSLSLVTSLQSFLDARKEVTQTVIVTSGDTFLIRAVVTARVRVLPNFSLSVLKTAAETAINGVLRDRQFGVSLYVSDLISAVLAVAGVSSVNVTLNGYTRGSDSTILTDRQDESGNLLIRTSEIVTRGSVTVSTELAG